MAKLYYKCGAMKSGKTSSIMNVYYNYLEKDKRALILKPGVDKKAGSGIMCRSGAYLDTDFVVTKDMDIYSLISNYIVSNNIAVIIVDEAQFLTEDQVDELTDVVDILNIPVLCYGLRADAFSHLFPGSKRLFEVADVIEELKAVCKCGKTATYNLRLEKVDGVSYPVFEGEQVSIDGIDAEYDSVCRNCYKKLRRKYGKVKTKDKEE